MKNWCKTIILIIIKIIYHKTKYEFLYKKKFTKYLYTTLQLSTNRLIKKQVHRILSIN